MLSKAEQRIYEQVLKGKRNQDIATEYNLAIQTVKFHITNIMRKHNVKSRTQLVLKAFSVV